MISLVFLSACGNGSDPIQKQKSNPQIGDAVYRLTFTSSWSAITHPDNFPSTPHFSGLIGATHNINVKIWEAGILASNGIESMAETGGKTTLTQEVNNQIIIGDADKVLSSNGLNPSPGQTEFTFTATPNYSFVTLVSMIAPSPDWFVGISGLNLLENGVWLENKTVDLFVYDAGTDDGANYISADADSNPKQLITKIKVSPFLVNGSIKPIGTFKFQKQ